MPITNGTLVIGPFTFNGGNGVAEGPIPSALEISIQDVDFDSGRTADGTMHRNRVAVKKKLKITWPAMTPEKVSRCLQAVESTSVRVTFLDPLTNTRYSGNFYAGDRTVPVFNYHLGIYDSFSYDLIEY